jgi:hypothetical protein
MESSKDSIVLQEDDIKDLKDSSRLSVMVSDAFAFNCCIVITKINRENAGNTVTRKEERGWGFERLAAISTRTWKQSSFRSFKEVSNFKILNYETEFNADLNDYRTPNSQLTRKS